jgi:hypothetical protein
LQPYRSQNEQIPSDIAVKTLAEAAKFIAKM